MMPDTSRTAPTKGEDRPPVPPTHCPMCGAGVEVVRHVAWNMFEMGCESCEATSVVLVNDHAKL